MNWRADPVACVLRLKDQRGCAVLSGRAEVMGRSTKVTRVDTPKGARYEWGHLYVRADGKPGQQRTLYAGINNTGHHAVETPEMTPEHANVMADLLRAAYVNADGLSCGGQTILEVVWGELMAVTERLMTGQDTEDDVGAARALAWVIAIMQNPYRPNVDSVREQVMERMDEHQVSEPPSPAPSRRTPRAARRRRVQR